MSQAGRERSGQVALVIGGSGGLGAAICNQLAEEGADLAFTYRSNEAAAGELADRLRPHDVRVLYAAVAIERSEEAEAFVEGVAQEFGRIDSLIYAAGPSFTLSFASRVAPEEWSRVIDQDVKGCFHVLRAALPHLRKVGGSFTAVITGAVDRPPALDVLSTAPKAAIQALVRTVAVEEGRFNVRANCLGPGFIDTGIGKSLLNQMPEEGAKAAIKAVPLRRLGTAQEIADGVAFLSSRRASFITGTTLMVTGGMEL